MSTSVPWSVKGIDRKARETAKDLARRSGMTLGEWLNHVIEYQGEGKVTPLPQTATLNESIERLTSRIEAVETRSTLAVTGIDQSVRGLAARIDTAEKTPRTANDGETNVAGAIKALEASIGRIAAQVYENESAQKAQLAEIRDELARMGREGQGAAAVDTRLKAMEGQIQQAEQRSTRAVEGIGHQVLRMAETLGKQVENVDLRTSAAVDRLGGEVARIADQMEMRLRQADEAQAQSLEKLGAEIERITEKLAERVNQTELRSAQALDALRANPAGEPFTFQPSTFGHRIRESEERTTALLEEARETVDTALEGRRAAIESADDEFIQAQAAAEEPPASDLPASAISPALYMPEALAEADDALDPFALDESEDPFADPIAEDTAEPVLAEAAAAPVIYPAEDAEATDYAFAPQDFQIVTADEQAAEAEAETEAAEGGARAEAEAFAKVDIEAADPFAPAEPFGAADPFSDDEAFAIGDLGSDELDPFAEAETTAVSDATTMEEAEAFEPGPFGRTKEPVEDILAPAESAADDEPLPEGEDEFVAAAADAPAAPVSRLEFIERARAAANASTGETKAGKGGGFAFGGFGMNRKRGGARLKSGLLMSTAVLVCLGSGLVGAAMLAPLLKEDGPKLTDKGLAKVSETAPRAAMMTNPQPIAAVAVTGTPLALPTAPAAAAVKPGDPDPALVYAESLSLLAAKDKRGVEMLTKAATLGYPQAELQLGHLYETGYPGLTRDLTQARKWTEKAADAGLPSAMHNLAMLIYNGEGGPRSPTLAAQWFRQAAELGQVDSQFNLGLLYENGKGVQANPAEAYKWFLLAGRGGDPQARAEAKAAAQRVRPLLSQEAMGAAERAAQAYGVQAAR